MYESTLDAHARIIKEQKQRIKQLEDDRKEVFDLAHTIALANIDDRLLDPINRIVELSKTPNKKEN